jgi:microsomal dipeptidase-like Zn-dependent dipeptidase
VRNNHELKETLKAGNIAIIHCVEGGFQLGASVEKIEEHVAELAERGVAYVTLAHLFFRGIATVAPALPFLSERQYHRLFHQPRQGLTSLGEAAVTAMFRNGVLVDITHMSEQAIKETLVLLGKLEAEYDCPPVPVIASHIACRFGKYKYNLSNPTIEMIGARNGVIGVIFCDHWMHDGPRKDDPRTRCRTFQIVKENIDRIERVTKSNHRCAAIGSDLDGFVKPMLRGLEDMGCMRDLEIWLRTEYNSTFAELILNGNALRVLESTWGHCKLKGRAHRIYL